MAAGTVAGAEEDAARGDVEAVAVGGGANGDDGRVGTGRADGAA
jgi:hypothetical protein